MGRGPIQQRVVDVEQDDAGGSDEHDVPAARKTPPPEQRQGHEDAHRDAHPECRAGDGYAFTGDAGDQLVVDAPATSTGSHGYVASDPDLRSLFIASGRGIRGGVTLDSVDVIDLAPTVARLLGFEMSGADGKVLTEVLALQPDQPQR